MPFLASDRRWPPPWSRKRRQSKVIPIGTNFSLVSACAEAALERGQGEVGQYRAKKQGDRHLRSLFTAGALAVIRYAKIHGTKHRPWLAGCCAGG